MVQFEFPTVRVEPFDCSGQATLAQRAKSKRQLPFDFAPPALRSGRTDFKLDHFPNLKRVAMTGVCQPVVSKQARRRAAAHSLVKIRKNATQESRRNESATSQGYGSRFRADRLHGREGAPFDPAEVQRTCLELQNVDPRFFQVVAHC